MTKKSVIWLSIIVFIFALTSILFGAVFCLRTQNVVLVGDSPIDVSREEIISTAGLKNGKSIFMLDKEKAIDNIENKYPNIKVVQIKTTSVTEIEFIIRARHEVYYTEYNNCYYVMDEELKVLRTIEPSKAQEPSNEPTNLILIEPTSLNISSSTMVCDFVGSKHQQEVADKLYLAVINNVKTSDEYYSREDFKEIINYVEFEEFASFDKIIVTTEYGVKLDIEDPANDLTYKMNICLTTLRKFIADGKGKEKSGTIKIYYNLEGEQQNVYIAEQD